MTKLNCNRCAGSGFIDYPKCNTYCSCDVGKGKKNSQNWQQKLQALIDLGKGK